ncbi:MAG: phage holin family protein [Bryobacteraceae bacterium]
MKGLFFRWVASVLALLVVTYVVPGIRVADWQTALAAPIIIGFVNATLGNILKLFSLPLTILTLGISSLVINALMLLLVSYFVKGFHVSGFLAAFLGSIVLSVANWVLRGVLSPKD